MKTTELMQKLQQLVDTHGDCDVYLGDSDGYDIIITDVTINSGDIIIVCDS